MSNFKFTAKSSKKYRNFSYILCPETFTAFPSHHHSCTEGTFALYSQWACIDICVCAQSLSHVWLCATPWSVGLQAPLSKGFPRQNTGVGCHFLFQRVFLTQGLNPRLLHLLHCQEDIPCPTKPAGKSKYHPTSIVNIRTHLVLHILFILRNISATVVLYRATLSP